MSWARFDDLYDDNRKIKRAWRRDRHAVGLHVLAITYCARHETDGLIDLDFIEDWIPNGRERARTLTTLTDLDLFGRLEVGTTAIVTDSDGNEIVLGPCDVEAFVVNDYLDYNLSSAQRERTREWDRKRKELHRDSVLVGAIRERDKDRCRYCGQQVNWKDRRGPSGATYDHVEPRGPNSFENVVIACRRCNLAKNDRTPERAGMPLLAPGSLGAGVEPSQNPSRSDLGTGQIQTQGRPSPLPDPSHPDPSPSGSPSPSETPTPSARADAAPGMTDAPPPAIIIGDPRHDKLAAGLGRLTLVDDPAEQQPKSKAIREAHEAWCVAVGKDPVRCKLDDKRRRIYGKAIDSHGLPEVIDALRGVRHSDHHMSNPQWQEPRVVLRDAGQIEHFAELERKHRDGARDMGESIERKRARQQELKQKGKS